MSLRWRLALAVGLVAAVAIALASVTSYLTTRAELNTTTDDFLRARALEFVDSRRGFERRGDDRRRGSGGPPPARLTVDEPDAVTQVLDANGVVIVASDPELPVDASARELAASGKGASSTVRRAAIERVEVDGASLAVITVPLPEGGAVQVGRDVSESQRVLDALRNRLILIVLAGTAAAALLAWVIAVGISRPLRRLSGAAEDVAATQDLDTRIDVTRRDEVGSLAESFNTMLAALDASRRQQRQLVDDASHELRTPLTSLRTNIEMLDRVEHLPPDDRRALLSDVTFELDQLADLVDEVVQSAAEVDARAIGMEDVELDRVALRAAERAERRFGRRVSVDAEPASTVGSPELIERAVSNLLGNAAKFAPGDDPIELIVRASTPREIIVRDGGPGVPADQLEAIFDRFHRTTEARDAPGSGLGLSIVRQIVTAHHGTVSAEAPASGGLIVTMRFPPGPGEAA
ncbi:MAG: HAMP domain-containing sensor histidine kinase [Miltoncostaeaceae bacterium]